MEGKPMESGGATVDPNASFIYFVYPFLYEAETFARRVHAVEQAQWQGRERPLTVWQMERFPEDDLLAHVARYLNPSKNTPPTAYLWELDGNVLQSPAGLGSQAEWWLTLPQGQLPMCFEAVRLALFRIGVGFLTVGARPTTVALADWLDFLHYFRFVKGQRSIGVVAQRQVGLDAQTRQPQVSPFFPNAAGGLAQHPDGRGTFDAVLAAILCTGSLPQETEPWWDEVFVPGQLLPFAALFVDQLPADETACLVYRLRNFFHARQEIYPAAEDLRLDHPALLPYAERQWFIFSLDGGSFVACDAPRTDFFRVQLPEHLRRQYFLLFLQALHQRFALMKLSEKVAQDWPVDGELTSDAEREAAFARIRDALLSFTARGHFAQVMQQEHHHRCYRKWQETFQVDRLYQEVHDEVKEMHDYLLLRRTERLQQQTRQLERLLSLLTVCIGIPALFISFLGINLYNITTKQDGLSVWLALGIVLSCSGLFGWVAWRFLRWYIRRRDHDPQAP